MAHFKMRKFILLILISTFSLTSFCQTATIKGVVFDRKENKGLAFAPILLKGYKIISATTDFNGDFKIDSVPIGLYDLQASFISYGDTTIKGINISSDTTVSFRLFLPQYCEYDKHNNDDTCPLCGKKGEVVPIFYGLPVGKMNEEKYYYAGCLVTFCQPNWYCKRCKHKF